MRPLVRSSPVSKGCQRVGAVRLLLFSALMAMALGQPGAAGAEEPPAVAAVAVPYYIAEAGESRGPLALDVLLAEIRDGTVLPWTLVWKPGLSGWIKAGVLPELGGALAEATPRPPPPPPQPPEIPAELPDETVYFLADGEVARGPLSEAEISAAIAAGELTAATLVWWPGADGWAAAGSVAALADHFTAAPPPVPATETMRQMMVGTWEFAPHFADTIGARTVLTFAPDMTFSGTVAVTLDEVAGEARPVAGSWAIGGVDDSGFDLVLRPDQGTEGVTRLRIVGHDTLEAESEGTTAHRVPG